MKCIRPDSLFSTIWLLVEINIRELVDNVSSAFELLLLAAAQNEIDVCCPEPHFPRNDPAKFEKNRTNAVLTIFLELHVTIIGLFHFV